jgi:hypothetical protein
MKATFWTMLALAMLTTGASAHKNDGCVSTLTMDDVGAAIGKDVRIQPVFANGQQKGWRIFGASSSTQLNAQGIRDHSLMTHVCGVPANDVFARKGDICCSVETSREFEVTFEVRDEIRKRLITRP